jgi:hypothetical protein
VTDPTFIYDDLLQLEERINFYRSALKKIAYAYTTPTDNYTKVFQKIAKDALHENLNVE